MTDADDEGLIKRVRTWAQQEAEWGESLWADALSNVADRLEAQRKEISDLRYERDEALKEHTDMMWQRIRADDGTANAEAALAEALKVIAPFAETAQYLEDNLGNLNVFPKFHAVPCSLSSVRAAAAFVKKHGGTNA
jgi:hypothetical protein